MNSLRIKFDDQLVSDRVEKLFSSLETVVNNATRAPQAISDIYTRFQEFFTTFGKPSFKPRHLVSGMPPWEDDYNAMVDEIVADVGTLFKELNTLMETGRGMNSLATAECDSVEGLIESIEKLLEDYQVYTEDIEEDLYVGDSFDDRTLISETNLTVDTEDGLISLQVLATEDHAQQAIVKVHGGSPDSWPGNLLQGVTPRSGDIQDYIPSPVKTSDISIGGQDTPVSTQADSSSVKELSTVMLSCEFRGENKWTSALVDGDASSVWEYEMMVVPQNMHANVDPVWPPMSGEFRWNNLLEGIPAQLQKSAGDPNIMTRHPMLVADPGPGNFPGIGACLSPGSTPMPVSDEEKVLQRNPSFTKGFDWKYQITDTEDAYKVRFVPKDWSQSDGTILEVNVELEWETPVNVTTLRVNPAILQDVGPDYIGADHFTLSDIGFQVLPFEGKDAIPQTVWGTDLALELPLDLYGPKTFTFPQQRVRSVVLYFTCDQPYKCKCAHPYLQRNVDLAIEAQKQKGGGAGYLLGKKRTSTVNVCLGDRYETSNPNIGDIVEYVGEGPAWGKKLAKKSGLAISDAVGSLLLGAFAAAGNLGNMAAQLASKAGFASGSGTVASAMKANFVPYLKGQISSAISETVSGGIISAPVLTSGGFNPHIPLPAGVYTPAEGIGASVSNMIFDPKLGWQDVNMPVSGNQPVGVVRFAYTKEKPPEIVTKTWVLNQLATNPKNAWWVDVNQSEGYERAIQRLQGDMAVKGMKQTGCVYTSGLGGPLGFIITTRLYFSVYNGPRASTSSLGVAAAGSNILAGLAGMNAQANSVIRDAAGNVVAQGPTGMDFGKGWTAMNAQVVGKAQQSKQKQEDLKDLATKPKETIMSKVSAGMASKIFALGGHLVANIVNTIIGIFIGFFKDLREMITGIKPVRSQIFYGMEGIPAYRYWIALKDVALESNLYADSGYLLSDWYDLDGNISRLSILTEEDVPTSFDKSYISYFVQFGETEDWYQIEPQAYPGTALVPKYIEINPKIKINNPMFREIIRTDENGVALETKKVRVRVELRRPVEAVEYSPKVLSYKLGVKLVS